MLDDEYLMDLHETNRFIYNQNRIGFEFSVLNNGQYVFIPFKDSGLRLENNHCSKSEVEDNELSEHLLSRYHEIKSSTAFQKIMSLRQDITKYSKKIVSCKIVRLSVFEEIKILNNSYSLIRDCRDYNYYQIEISLNINNQFKTVMIHWDGKNEQTIFTDLKNLVKSNTILQYSSKSDNLFFDSGIYGFVIHEIYGHMLENDFCSVDSFNKKVHYKSNLTIIEGICGDYCYNYDDDGNLYKSKILVNKGCFLNKIGTMRRQNYRYPSMPRMVNTYLNPDINDKNNVLSSMHNGLLIKDILSGYVNPETKDVFLWINEAYEVYDGEIGNLVSDFFIKTSVLNFLNAETVVCNDLTMIPSMCIKRGQSVFLQFGAPSVLQKDVNFITSYEM